MRVVKYFFLKPISYLYSLILVFRHWLYDHQIFLKSTFFKEPIIVFGNLSLGGSGKTPHTIFLCKLIESVCSVNIVSRGYGRKTNDLRKVKTEDKYSEVGDEPLMMKHSLNNIPIFVSNKRVQAIQYILNNNPNAVVLLDDAFQHRKLSTKLNILLTEYDKLYINDNLIPYGTLRDIKNRSQKAQIIIVTKTNKSISEEEKKEIKHRLNLKTQPLILFSFIEYLTPICFYTKKTVELNSKILVVSAIANSKPFINFLNKNTEITKHYKYADHKNFDLNEVNKWINNAKINDIKQIVTTEKDATRLNGYKDVFLKNEIDLIVIPIEVSMQDSDKKLFKETILEYIKNCKD